MDELPLTKVDAHMADAVLIPPGPEEQEISRLDLLKIDRIPLVGLGV